MFFLKQHPKLPMLCLAVVLIFVAAFSGGPEARGQGAAPPPTPVFVTEVRTVDVPIISEYPAQTYARDTVEVRGRVSGYVEKWLFKPGQEVRAGDVLYVLDQRPYEAALVQAKGNLAQSEADLDFAQKQVAVLQAEASLAVAQANMLKAQQDVQRLEPLVKQDAAPKQDLETAQAALDAAKANVRASQASVEQARLSTRTQIASTQGKVEALRGAVRANELNVEYATITAPIGGLIGDTLVPVGGLVNSTSAQPMTTIVPLDPIWVRFKVTESEYLTFKKRGNLTQSSLALILADGTPFPSRGRVENTANEVDPKTGTLELQARFPNPRHFLLPGQFGRVRIETEMRKGVMVIPQRAVQQLQNMQTVLVVGQGNKVETAIIAISDRAGDNFIVDRGLKPGDRVIVEGQLKVRPGMTVAPSAYQAAAASPASGAARSPASGLVNRK